MGLKTRKNSNHSRWGNQRFLAPLVFLAVREALNAPSHPDSKRQARRKQRDLERYGARVLKESFVVSCPAEKTNKRRQVRDMQRRLAHENSLKAFSIARRLQGKAPWPELHQPVVPVAIFDLLAQLHQAANLATGASYAV